MFLDSFAMSGVNNMDSINRPTSKVLRPPGGQTSNIFGTEPEGKVEGKKHWQQHKGSNIFANDDPPPQAPPVKTQGKTSNIFGSDPTPQAAPAPAARASSNIFGDEPAVHAKPAKPAPSNNIFGEAEEKTTAATKVMKKITLMRTLP